MATYDGQQWNWTCDNQVSDPPNDPHAGFWTTLQCVEPGAKRSGLALATPQITVTPLEIPVDRIRLANPAPPLERPTEVSALLGKGGGYEWARPETTSIRPLAETPVSTLREAKRRRR